jgi:hypothetical protein
MISNFRRGVNQFLALLGCYATLIVNYQHIGPILKGEEVQEKNISWSLKMGPIRCPETSVNSYNTTLSNISEERISQVHNHRTTPWRRVILKRLLLPPLFAAFRTSYRIRSVTLPLFATTLPSYCLVVAFFTVLEIVCGNERL